MKCERIMLSEHAGLDAYIADPLEGCTRKALLVIPGGGYSVVCADREGEPIAHAFMPYGFNCFVLHYSVAGEKVFPAQLIEASQAMRHIKDHAAEYGIDKDQVFAVGFSAGGHLCASLGTMWHKQEIYDELDMPYGYNKPKGVMLVYPVISGVSNYSHRGSFQNLFGTSEPTREQLEAASIEKNVRADSAPAFIVHTVTDEAVPVENSLLLASAYQKHHVPFELHIYPKGIHGFALGNEITWCNNPNHVGEDLASWISDAVKWTEKID